METTITRKAGRPKGSGAGRLKYAMTLDADLAEWGKARPGGLSATVRALMREAMSNEYWAKRANEAAIGGFVGQDAVKSLIDRMNEAE